jgi:hypothetical protein
MVAAMARTMLTGGHRKGVAQLQKMTMGIASLALIGAFAGCQAKYENEARAVAAAQNAETAAVRAEAAAARAEQAVTRAEAAMQRAENAMANAEEQMESHGRRR